MINMERLVHAWDRVWTNCSIASWLKSAMRGKFLRIFESSETRLPLTWHQTKCSTRMKPTGGSPMFGCVTWRAK